MKLTKITIPLNNEQNYLHMCFGIQAVMCCIYLWVLEFKNYCNIFNMQMPLCVVNTFHSVGKDVLTGDNVKMQYYLLRVCRFRWQSIGCYTLPISGYLENLDQSYYTAARVSYHTPNFVVLPWSNEHYNNYQCILATCQHACTDLPDHKMSYFLQVFGFLFYHSSVPRCKH